MTRHYISVCQTTTHEQNNFIYITSTVNGVPLKAATTRTSPIYSAYADATESQILCQSNGFAIFFYTLDTFCFLADLDNKTKQNQLRGRIFISHGLSSVVAIVDNESEKDFLVLHARKYAFAYEVWKFSDNCICEITVVPKQCDTNEHIDFEWPIGDLSHEDAVFIDNVAVILKESMNTARRFAPQYSPALKSIEMDIRTILHMILFLNGISTSGESAPSVL